MKKIIGVVPAWGLYYIGDFTCKIMIKLEFNFLFKMYNWCMVKSGDIQDWAELEGPWSEPNE